MDESTAWELGNSNGFLTPETLRSSGYGADASKSRRSSSRQSNHWLGSQSHCCPLLGPPSAPGKHPQVSSHHAVCPSRAERPLTVYKHLYEVSPANPQGSLHSLRDQVRGSGDCTYWMGSGNGRNEEEEKTVWVKSGPRAPHHLLPHCHKMGAHQKKGSNHMGLHSNWSLTCILPIWYGTKFWLQKQSWQQILSWKFITCLYTELPESFIDTYLTISAFASVVNEINRAWKSVSTEKGPLLWRNNSLGLPETNKCSASETD